jgi:hypothetical protein
MRENRVGGGALLLGVDPLPYPFQTFGGLVNVVAIGNIKKSAQDLFETFGFIDRRRHRGFRKRAILGNRLQQNRHPMPAHLSLDLGAAAHVPAGRRPPSAAANDPTGRFASAQTSRFRHGGSAARDYRFKFSRLATARDGAGPPDLGTMDG